MAQFKLGDAFKVRKGVKDPDFPELDLSGWQGRMVEFNVEDSIVLLEWDSITLKGMEEKYIEMSIDEDLDYFYMSLELSEVEKTKTRDTPELVKEVQDEMMQKYGFTEVIEIRDEVIAEILDGIPDHDIMAKINAWKTYFDKELAFPMDMIVAESQEKGKIKQGDKVQVTSLSEYLDEMCGIFATGECKKQKIEIPFADLEIADEEHKHFQLLRDYRVWFANL